MRETWVKHQRHNLVVVGLRADRVVESPKKDFGGGGG